MNKPTIAAKTPIPADLEAGKNYYFCTCGKSANQPFCDGSHKGSSFEPQVFTVPEGGKFFLCRCKQSSNLPFCDGKHAQVPDDQVGKEFALPSEADAD